MKKLLSLCLLVTVFIACNKDESSSDSTDDSQMDIIDPQEVANLMNENLIVANSFLVDPNSVPTTTNVVANSAAVGRMPVKTGIDNVNTITFTPAAGTGGNPVTAVGMRFGPTGDIIFREVSTEEAEAGIASFVFSIDPSLCDDIAQICHDIKCYEFAQTSSGAITQADLQDIAAVCAACDEPSCLDLLDEGVCESNGVQGASGDPRFNLTWTGGTDLDLYVTDPNGDTISFSNESSPSGGLLDVDCLGNCSGGNSENIFWETGGPSGSYSFYVNYFSGSAATPFTITVFENTNVISTHTGSVSDGNPDSAIFQYVR